MKSLDERYKPVPRSSSSANETMKPTASTRNRWARPRSGFTSLLSYLLAGSLVYCYVVTAQLDSNRVNVVPTGTVHAASADKAMKQDALINEDEILLESRNHWTLLMALKELCANDPTECQPANCTMAEDHFKCNPSARETLNGELDSDEWKNSKLAEPDRSNRTSNQFAGWDELTGSQSSWLPKLSLVESERYVGTQDNQRTISSARWSHRPPAATSTETIDDIEKSLLSMLEHYAALVVGGDLEVPTTSGGGERPAKVKRDRELGQKQREQQRKWRPQQNQRYQNARLGKQRSKDNKTDRLRLTVEQAKRIIRAYRQDRARLVAGSRLSGRSDDLMIVPKRTGGMPGDQKRLDGTDGGGGGAEASRPREPIVITKTSGDQFGHALTAQDALASSGGDESAVDPNEMQCNMRRFVYRATKTDQAGNQCTGLITANICYGACETGEIPDWLFPHKKPFHNVCRHGGRVRRMRRLTECTSSSGLSLALDGLGDDRQLFELQQYHYVDALNCACKRCISADTTCLGTMSRPSLPTLSEIGQLDGSSNTDDNNQQPKYRQQISSLDID